MLNRLQIYNLLTLREREGNLFSKMPVELIKRISNFGQEDSGVSDLLHSIILGDVTAVEDQIKVDPRLVLQACNVSLPSGDLLKRVTPLECALGCGDHTLATIIISHIIKFPDGNKVKEDQCNRYRPHIETMLTAKPYDFGYLVKAIKGSSKKEMIDVLNHNFKNESDLSKALIKFRDDTQAKVIIKAGMHFNYSDMINVYKIYNEFHKNKNEDACKLIWQKVLGRIQLKFPTILRFAYANNLYCIMIRKQPLDRRLNLREVGLIKMPNLSGIFAVKEFPMDGLHTSIKGPTLGLHYAISAQGSAGEQWPWFDKWGTPACMASHFEKYCKIQQAELLKIVNPAIELQNKEGCVIC